MSAMIEAIERIAAYYSSFDAPTSLDMKVFYWMLNNGYDAVGKDVRELRKSLSPETLQKVVSNYSTPKLTLEQIQEITRDYPFQLPLEIIDLYQKGNGCLPIGLADTSKDWNSFDNYFNFPFITDDSFFSLEKAMSMYKGLVRQAMHSDKIDPRWFPIDCFEDLILAVIGSEEQQVTSPVISFYDSDFILKIEWPSLTNMLLAWVEIREQSLNEHEHEFAIEKIHKKYSKGKSKTA